MSGFCRCGVKISRGAKQCKPCRTEQRRIPPCACGAKLSSRRTTQCRDCWIASCSPDRVKSTGHVCACGAWKAKQSKGCKACYDKARSKPPNRCACGTRIQRKRKQCRPCYRGDGCPTFESLTEDHFRLYPSQAFWVAEYMADGRRKTVSRAAWRWVKANGPVPAGHVVVHVSDDLADDSPENIELVTKAEQLSFMSASQRTPMRQCPVCMKVSRFPRRQATCGRRCAGVASRSRVVKTCDQCEVQFEAKISQQRRFCSRSCAAEGRRREERRTCPTCGAGFSVTPKSTKRYCSLRCVHLSHKILAKQRAAGEA